MSEELKTETLDELRGGIIELEHEKHQLTRRVAELGQQLADRNRTVEAVTAKSDLLAGENERLMKALEFYADGDKYCTLYDYRLEIVVDGGAVARAALQPPASLVCPNCKRAQPTVDVLTLCQCGWNFDLGAMQKCDHPADATCHLCHPELWRQVQPPASPAPEVKWCKCALRNRQWDPLSGRCMTCTRKIKTGDSPATNAKPVDSKAGESDAAYWTQVEVGTTGVMYNRCRKCGGLFVVPIDHECVPAATSPTPTTAILAADGSWSIWDYPAGTLKKARDTLATRRKDHPEIQFVLMQEVKESTAPSPTPAQVQAVVSAASEWLKAQQGRDHRHCDCPDCVALSDALSVLTPTSEGGGK